MKIGITAPLALSLLGAAPPLPQKAPGETCSVHYSRILLGSYEQPTAKRTLPALMVAGTASPGGQAFNFFDDDGFLTLAMLVSAWQAGGQTAANLTADVTVDRGDIVLMEYVSRVGSGYFQAILDYAATRNDLTAQQVIEVDQAKAQLALFQRMGTQARASLAANGGDGTNPTLPRHFITDLGDYLETLRPSASQAVNSRYNDLATQKTSRLCDPDAPSALLGRMLCDRNLGTGAVRATPYCRSSAGITSPARALVCEVHGVDGKSSATNCTDGAGGKSVPAPPAGG